MATFQACDSYDGDSGQSARVHGSDRIVEVFYDWLLFTSVFAVSTWPHFVHSVETFRFGVVEFPSKAMAGVIVLEALLLLTRRQTFGMLMINAHVVHLKSGVKAGALRYRES